MALLKDLGCEVESVLALGAKATEQILHRHGIGRLKHIDVAYPWMQDAIRSKRLRVRRVKCEENVADLVSKPLSKAVIAKHCFAVGLSTWPKKVFRVSCKTWRCFGTLVRCRSGREPRGKIQTFVTGGRTVSLQNLMTGDRLPAWRSQLVTTARRVHVRSAAAAAVTDTVAQLIEAFKVSDRDQQRLHQRSRVASSDREFE